MKIATLEVVKLQIPLVMPFVSAHSSQVKRELFLVKITTTEGIVGWGENVAEVSPGYSNETSIISLNGVRSQLGPRILSASDVTISSVSELFADVSNLNFAKASLEQAILDAELKVKGISVATWLGATRAKIRPGVVVGLQENLAESLSLIDSYLHQGYRRIKFKVEPGRDYQVVSAVRSHVGSEVIIQVDANGSYSMTDIGVLSSLDEFDLAMIEQPFGPMNLVDSAKLSKIMKTPICLDESITDLPSLGEAARLGAGSIINVKPGRVGGVSVARAMHDFCLDNGLGAWVGGMLETGVGRTLNLALAGMEGFNFPSDISASNRYFETDLTEPFVMVDGQIGVPNEPGASREPIADVLKFYEAETELIEV